VQFSAKWGAHWFGAKLSSRIARDWRQFSWPQGWRAAPRLAAIGVCPRQRHGRDQAFLQKPSGTLVFAAGKDTHLYPATEYTAERLYRIYGDKKFLSAYSLSREPEIDRRFLDDLRVTKASSSGRFEFRGLAPGKYFIETALTYHWQDLLYGGRFYEVVEVGEGAKVEVVLTGG
jgi:hypothetical protein